MKDRCFGVNHPKYPEYGARGVTVCERWRTFENFYADMGPRPSMAHSLDRYPDQNGNYEPGNVRWATVSQQQSNKRNAVLIEYQGERLNVAEWSRRTGIASDTIAYRLRRGWPVERILTVAPHLGNGSRCDLTRPRSTEGAVRL